jgi:hypothetical protein
VQPGQKLAHYEIVEPIGKGGMGEVYRARDTKLGRDVAIKVLPDEFGQDEERLRRFQREAKVLASLNHPNIAAIYGLEEEDDTHYLVLELVPGETLAERIARGPIPVEEALEIATKIADALEEAHERGIVHRDLKPANVKLTEGGKIKVLDFGLAKAFAEEGAEGDAATSMSPTITRDATRVGVILGTAAYMSPEQAKGKQIDRRADVWAFGAVLYEMLTGRRAFEGEDVSETLAYVLTKEPDWDALPADTPPALRRTLQLCLTKKPKGRIRDMADMQLALAGAFGTVEAAHDGTHSPRSVGWAAIGIGLILATTGAVRRQRAFGSSERRARGPRPDDLSGWHAHRLRDDLRRRAALRPRSERARGDAAKRARRQPATRTVLLAGGELGGLFLGPDLEEGLDPRWASAHALRSAEFSTWRELGRKRIHRFRLRRRALACSRGGR